MKYAMIIPDGCADEALESLTGLTPLQSAKKPAMDQIAREGVLGRSSNVPERFLPASDVATLSLLGYDPCRYYTGRAPLEAASMGISLGPDDWAVRCNLMTILDGKMTDFTAGHISSAEGRELMAALKTGLGTREFEFHAGVSYRNALIVRGKPGESLFEDDTVTTPPHDVPDLPSVDYLPRGTGSEVLRDLNARGTKIVRDHPVNRARVAAGKRPANAVWLWGQGRAPRLRTFKEMHGLKGAMVSAVDLVRGVAILAGWDRVDAPGATGYLDTDYASKGRTAIAALADHDIVCVHIEAPDEASHEGKAQAKIEAIEHIDHFIVGPLHEALKIYGDYRILVTPDHSTLLRTRAHDRAMVCWAMSGCGLSASSYPYDEISAAKAGGPKLDEGWRLMELFLKA